jgi:hypothetical protein
LLQRVLNAHTLEARVEGVLGTLCVRIFPLSPFCDDPIVRIVVPAASEPSLSHASHTCPPLQLPKHYQRTGVHPPAGDSSCTRLAFGLTLNTLCVVDVRWAASNALHRGECWASCGYGHAGVGATRWEHVTLE